VAEHPATRRFIEQQVLLDKRPKTVDAYARALDHLFRYFVGVGPGRLVEADEDDVLGYLAHLKRRSPRKRGRGGMVDDAAPPSNVRQLGGRTLADSTIAQHVVACRLFYDFLIRKRLRRDPVNPIPYGRRGGEGRRPERGPLRRRERLPWLPDDAAWARFVAHVITGEDARTRALLLLAYDAALRREEVVSLRLGDIDWARGLVSVRAETTKNGRQRHVPVSAGALHLLRHYVDGDRALLLRAYGGDPDGPLFLSESTRNPARPLTPGTVNEIMGRVRATVGLPALTPHTLRHQRCTTLKRAGVSVEDIRVFAGHKCVASTELYIHLIPTELGRRIQARAEPFDAPIRALVARTLGSAVAHE